ncbi:MAG: TIGR03089 family protein [Mycobacterium sp.]
MMNLTDAILDPLQRADPMGPRITYYDDATGERIELSTVTLANWAAKTANLLRDELGAGNGTRVAVLLPAHWQTAAVLLGVWWIGAEVVLSGTGAARPATSGTGAAGPATSGTADVALCTADRLDEADDAVAGGEVAVLSLDPFGKPVPDLPIGVTDYATAVRVHGDQVVPEQHPGPALDGRAVAEVLGAARDSAAKQDLSAYDRVMSSAPWSTADEVVTNLLAVFVVGASLVQVANPDRAALERRRQTEKVTRDLAG